MKGIWSEQLKYIKLDVLILEKLLYKVWYIWNRGPNFEDLHTHLLKDMHAMKALLVFSSKLNLHADITGRY